MTDFLYACSVIDNVSVNLKQMTNGSDVVIVPYCRINNTDYSISKAILYVKSGVSINSAYVGVQLYWLSDPDELGISLEYNWEPTNSKKGKRCIYGIRFSREVGCKTSKDISVQNRTALFAQRYRTEVFYTAMKSSNLKMMIPNLKMLQKNGGHLPSGHWVYYSIHPMVFGNKYLCSLCLNNSSQIVGTLFSDFTSYIAK